MTKSWKYFTKVKTLNIVGALFIFAGLALLAVVLYFRFAYSPVGATSNIPTEGNVGISALQQAERNKTLVSGYPVNISVPGPRPDLNMNVPVIPGIYDKQNKSWTLSERSAMFANISTPPNNITGNTFIYGHYRPNVFAYMHLITPGTVATVTTNNGIKFMYKYENTYAVKPNQTSVLAYSVSPVLTIQTCSGTFFQNRQMYIFKYVGYVKS